MESVGVLAGGIAHDFNNLLTVISGYTEILLNGLRPEDRSYDLLREIHRAGERAAGLTRQLLAFSRKQILNPRLLDVNVLVTDTMKMLRRMIGEDIDLATALDPALARVKADPGQIEQVLMNLVVNARDAMPTGGRITVETRNVVLDRSYADSQPGVQPGPYVLMAVSDTGQGMDEATKTHVFEPFFTTKEVGKGTGLGLATVDGIVKQTGGHVTVYSEVGRGTAFKIYLPCAIGVDATEDASLDVVQAARGSETVLLVEDEDTVRMLAQNTLQSYGYNVLESRNGEEALEICARFPDVIHLLVTDVVMPKMSGRQLAEVLLEARPGLKVLYLSGYTDDAVIRHGVLNSGAAFLQKPFSPITLGRKVREVLDAKQH
jgi:CheY-like chemotaxis protein